MGVFSSLFILCLVVSQIRQRLHAKRKHRDWSARYTGRAQQRLENKRRIWAMFGLEYKGTIDDVRQSDDEDEDEDDGDDACVGEPKFGGHRQAVAHADSPYTLAPPPPYNAGTTGEWGICSAPSSLPQCPERCHDNRRDEDMNHEIVSPMPQRHFQLRAPELVASGPLHRSDTIRSVRRCPTPPVSKVVPKANSFNTNQSNAESSIASLGLEPPVSPRRLDSISRRRNDEG